jgi:diacylglycerol kinase (ATP)
MKKRIRILVNPSARSGRGPRALHDLRYGGAAPEPSPSERIEWVESRSAAHLMELVQEAQEPGEELFALGIAGGDGSVGLALDALRTGGQRVPLGVLPVGSGNDFAHSLGIRGSAAAAYATLRGGSARFVDVAEARPELGRFCCVASVGLDELALRRIHGSRFSRSKALNIYAALRALIDYRPRAVEVRWQGGQFAGEVMFCAVTNTRSYGGGFQISPRARIDDGLLDLCIVRRTSKLRLLRQFPRILRGTHDVVAEVILAQSPWVEIRPPQQGTSLDALPLCIDGELPVCNTPVELRCLPQALCVLTPTAVAKSQAPEAVRVSQIGGAA